MAVLARTLSGTLPAAQLSAYRFGIGLIGMVALLAYQKRRPSFARPGLLLLRGGLGGLAAFLYFYAIEHVGVGVATMLNYISPVYAAIFAVIFLKERAHAQHWAGLVIATVGAVGVTAAQTKLDSFAQISAGALAGLASGILGGAAMTTVKALRDEAADPAEIFISFCAVGLAVVLVAQGPAWKPLTLSLLPKVIGVGLLSIGGQLLFTYAMRFTSTATGSATTQLVPVLVWVMAVAFLDERLTGFTVAGAALCTSGVFIAASSPRFR